MRTIMFLLALAGFVLPANAQYWAPAQAGPYRWRQPIYMGLGYYAPPVALAVFHSNRPLAGPTTNNRSAKTGGKFTLANSTRYSVEVFLGKGSKGKYQWRLAPGESRGVKGPKPGETYKGFALIPASDGSLASDEVPIQPVRTGWVFVEPDCVRQKGER